MTIIELLYWFIRKFTAFDSSTRRECGSSVGSAGSNGAGVLPASSNIRVSRSPSWSCSPARTENNFCMTIFLYKPHIPGPTFMEEIRFLIAFRSLYTEGGTKGKVRR